MSSNGNASSIFTGNSRYALDFQAIIDRTVGIASLPLSQLNRDKTALTDRSTALITLDTKFASLQTAVDAIQDSLGSASYQAEVSNPAAASATAGTGIMQGTYSIKVIDMGSYTTTLSPAPDETLIMKVADPGKDGLTGASTYTLTVDGNTRTITAANKSLTALAAAINSDTASGVRATVVNVGSSGDPNYRLSVQSTKLGPVSIDLKAGTTTLLEQETAGALATYNVSGAKANGEEVIASSNSRTVEIAPGLRVTLKAAGTVDITVARNSQALSDALAGFTEAYNGAVDELDKHRGEAGGVLAGQSILYSLSRTLADLTGYQGSGETGSIQELGLSFDRTGHLSFNSLTFLAANFISPEATAAFLGDKTAGGFLKAATGPLDLVERTASGMLKTEMTSITAEIGNVDRRIAESQARVDQMKTSLYERMATTDAMIAALEQQFNYLSSMFESMRASSQSYR